MTPNIPQQTVDSGAAEEKPKHTFTIHHVLLNTPLRILLALGLMAIILPCLIYVYVYSQRIFLVRDSQIQGTCSHNIIYQVPCGNFNLTEELCEDRKCCFTKQNGCFHSLPSRYQYNRNNQYVSPIIFYSSQSVTPFGIPSTLNLRLITKTVTESRLIIELWDSSENVTTDDNLNSIENKNYKFRIFQNTMFSVDRSNGKPLLTTSRGPLIVSRNFLEWNFHLNTPYLYGLGEGLLKPGLNKLVFNSEHDNFIPFIIAYDPESTNYHAISFKTRGPLEIDITESNLLIVKALYSKHFFIELFTGPTLGDILKEIRPELPLFPDWILGIHVCRQTNSYNIFESIVELNGFLKTNNFPFDSHCYHENLINLQNIDTVLRNSQILGAIDLLKLQKKAFFVALHLEVEMDEKLSLHPGNMLRHPRTNNDYQGLIDNKTVLYIDWMNSNLNNMLKDIWQLPSSRMELIDGFSLHRNWMKDESTSLKTLDPRLFQYIPEGISERLKYLLPWNTRLSNSEDVILESLNNISSSQINYLNPILENKIMMTSSFNLDVLDQAVLIHSYLPTWLTFRASVSRIVSMGLNGQIMAGSQVCGDLVNSETESTNPINEELCIRWYQFASMTPIFRLRSDRTPDKFSAYAKKLMNEAILRRYSLISYFQTVLFSSNPLLTPMFYYFPDLMLNATELAEQFTIGKGLLVAPVLMAKATHKTIYFPDDYYEINGGMHFESETSVEFPVVESDFPMFLRTGFIIGLHNTEDVWTIREAQEQPLKLFVGLNCTERNNNKTECNASGRLTLKQNYSLDFTSTEEKLEISITTAAGALNWDEFCKTDIDKLNSKTIESITIYGWEKMDRDNEIHINLNICEPHDTVLKLNGLYVFKY